MPDRLAAMTDALQAVLEGRAEFAIFANPDHEDDYIQFAPFGHAPPIEQLTMEVASGAFAPEGHKGLRDDPDRVSALRHLDLVMERPESNFSRSPAGLTPAQLAKQTDEIFLLIFGTRSDYFPDITVEGIGE